MYAGHFLGVPIQIEFGMHIYGVCRSFFFGLTTHISYCDGDKISFFADISTMFIQSCSDVHSISL